MASYMGWFGDPHDINNIFVSENHIKIIIPAYTLMKSLLIDPRKIMSNEVMTTVSLAGGPRATLVFNVSTACLMNLVSIIINMVAVMHLR